MTNWKQFKNWLEKEIIVNEGLVVKIRREKRNIYGELSETILTNFLDSLEATLDGNNSYYLFPIFEKDKDFGQLFNGEQALFGKRTSQKIIKVNDYNLLEKIFSEWKQKEALKEQESFRNELVQIVYPGTSFFEGYNANNTMLAKIRELVNKVPDLENELKLLQEKYEKAVAEKAKKSSNLKDDEKATTNSYEEKNNEILQLKRRLELLEESRNEMVNNREERVEELENRLQVKENETNWLKKQLQKYLGAEYKAKIEVNYPARFKK